eukprot:14714696-Ditylum_brightwellii.AAC.1
MHQRQDPSKVLLAAEKEKKKKYLDACIERRRTFTPLVYSADGMAGAEAWVAEKRLASHLSNKLKRAYSEICGYVRSRMALAAVRTNTLLLRRPRDKSARLKRPVLEDGAGQSAPAGAGKTLVWELD